MATKTKTKTKSKELDATTEEKIKAAAKLVFHKKGFAATRTRDIAEEAGINLALLNYYFRSKEKLFDIIMLETMQVFLRSIGMVFNDESTNFEEKIEAVVSAYIDLLLKEPQIPLFVLSELKTDPNAILKTINVKQMIGNSVLMIQYKQAVKDGKIAPLHIMHFVTNLMGLTVFPFVASPILKAIGDANDEQFKKMVTERKKLIPMWIKAMLKAK